MFPHGLKFNQNMNGNLESSNLIHILKCAKMNSKSTFKTFGLKHITETELI